MRAEFREAIHFGIAAIAATLGNATVVTMDSDLSAVPGLTVENRANP
jgi:tRNA(fMet)-specific endonuclease VapC